MPPALKLITDHTSEAAPVAEFAEAMSALASGVVLVTCWLDGRPWGLTVTAFASVSAGLASTSFWYSATAIRRLARARPARS